jgi:pullulanase
MNNKKFFKGVGLAALLTIGALTPSVAKKLSKPLEVDNATYEEPRIVDFNNPDFVGTENALAAKSASSVSIHYHNGDGLCGIRELWIWCDGVSGSAFTPEVSADGKDMTVSFQFTGEYAGFAGKSSLWFIVKYLKGTEQGGGDGWQGQSENLELSYEEFEPNEQGLTEIWCIPGEGNAVEIYPTKELSEMDRVQLADFTDWKTIEVTATAQPTTYRIYALTSYYMSHQLSANLEDYLFLEGSNPSCVDVDFPGQEKKSKKFTIHLNYTPKINIQYLVEAVFPEYPTYKKTKYISSYKLYETDRFRQYYSYDGDDLGVTYNPSNKSATFKVWTPTSASVRLRIYNSGTARVIDEETGYDSITEDPTATNSYGEYAMAFRPGGIWEVTVSDRDLAGKYYTYSVYNSLGNVETIDPYAKACGVNGKRGMIVDWSKTNPTGWDNVPLKWDGSSTYDIAYPNSLSIYETHIRDLTMDESWHGTSMPGTYSAFSEKNTTLTKDAVTVKTGFDHLEELGVNAIHLLPVFDHANTENIGQRSYNWGYNPLNYNCIEGSYATDPYDGAARIKEFKDMILKFANNENHARIIMDVVYNHVDNIGRSSFNKLMPKYYFRYEPTSGSPYNGSGCGNEVKTEAPMMSKYIVDSLCWWAKEYKIKGFRFDLMALIDWQTAKKAAKELYKIDPDIYLYGEGWSADGSSGNMDNKNPGDTYYGNWGCDTWTVYNKLIKENDMCFVGTFNNAGRNDIAGETGKIEENGFIDMDSGSVGNRSSVIADLLVGYHSGQERVDPNQCVNYSSCHDDFTTFDHLMYATDGYNDYPGLPCAATAAVESTIMFSNGVALMRGGEETFQSKKVSQADLDEYGYDRTVKIRGDYISSNSYHLSDATNAFKWDRKISIDGVNTKQYFDAIKDAVKARKQLTKYNKEQLDVYNPFSSTSPINVWNRGDGSTVIGMKNGEYFFFVAGCNNNNIPFGAINEYNKQVFSSNPAYDWKSHSGSDYLKLGWFMCVCLTK